MEKSMLRVNIYENIDYLVDLYKSNEDKLLKKDALNDLIQSFLPLIIKNAKHYFGFVDEDLVQDGIVRFIELVDEFDFSVGSTFNGYVKRKIRTFYHDKKRYEKRCDILYVNDENLINMKSYDYHDFESYSVMYSLDEKQRYIVSKNILNEISLKEVSKEMGISYVYAKKLKKSALLKLKEESFS